MRTLGGQVWYPGSPYSNRGKVLRGCKGLVGNKSAHMIPYYTEDCRMCDHHDGRFKAEFSFYMSRILASKYRMDHTFFVRIASCSAIPIVDCFHSYICNLILLFWCLLIPIHPIDNMSYILFCDSVHYCVCE